MAIAALRRSGDNVVEASEKDSPRIRLQIDGKGNTVRISALKGGGTLDIRIFGDGNTVEICEGCGVAQTLRIVVGQDHPHFGPVSGSGVRIGARTTVESCSMFIYTSRSNIELGDDCMVSYGVTLYHGDAHPVLDLATGRIRNHVGTMHVGSHVWIGARATLLKNAYIADDCLVGFGSVVSGRFEKPHCALAGNPAKCVTGVEDAITWARSCPGYVDNATEDGA